MSEMALDELKLLTISNKIVFWLVCSFEKNTEAVLPYKRRSCLVQEEHRHFQIVVFLGMEVERLPQQMPASPDKKMEN